MINVFNLDHYDCPFVSVLVINDGHPTEIPPKRILGGVLKNCQYIDLILAEERKNVSPDLSDSLLDERVDGRVLLTSPPLADGHHVEPGAEEIICKHKYF